MILGMLRTSGQDIPGVGKGLNQQADCLIYNPMNIGDDLLAWLDGNGLDYLLESIMIPKMAKAG